MVLIFIFALLTFVIVRAADPAYSVTIEEINSENYPQIQLSFKLTGSVENLVARHFSIYENGKINNGPIVLLPPKNPNNKIDLFIFLDRSGNTKSYESIIKSNLKSLVHYMKNNEVDLDVKMIDFGSTDLPQNTDIKTFASEADFNDSVDGLVFDSARPSKVYGLNKIDQIASSQGRSGADKVVLIINGSQFYDQKLDDATTFNVAETVNKLFNNGFTVFVTGYPLKQLHALRTLNTEDGSLSHSVPGGYLGGFAIDLTVIDDLLKKQNTGRYVLQYYSENPGGGSAQLYIQDNFVENFSYSRGDSSTPMMIHTTGNEAIEGHSLPIRVEVAPNGQLINIAEMSYLDESTPPKLVKSVLIHEKTEDTENNMIYTGEIPEGGFPSDFARYYVKVYTPYDVIGSEDEYVSIPVFAYDEDIILKSTIVNNEEVIWRWEGKTVDMGEKYQLWAGDEMIIETKDRLYTLPADECDKYQVVKVRVLLKAGADHPSAGTWSNFSRQGEVFVGTDGELTESEGINIMISCLENKEYQTNSAYIQTEPNYSASKKLYMDKMTYYVTGITDPTLKSKIRLDRYALLYYLMNFINGTEYSKYSNSSVLIPRSMVYKVVTNSNQKDDLSGAFQTAVEELARRMRGSSSF